MLGYNLSASTDDLYRFTVADEVAHYVTSRIMAAGSPSPYLIAGPLPELLRRDTGIYAAVEKLGLDYIDLDCMLPFKESSPTMSSRSDNRAIVFPNDILWLSVRILVEGNTQYFQGYVVPKHVDLRIFQETLKETTINCFNLQRELGYIRPDALTKDIVLEPSVRDDLLNDLDAFMQGYEDYKREGIPWRRGYVFYGPPGNGKTSIIRAIAQNYGLRVRDIYDCIDRNTNAVSLSSCEDEEEGTLEQKYGLTNFPKPIMYIMEDLDKLLENSELVPRLLNAIDGVSSTTDGCLIIATTNYPDELAENIFSRPGRFDKTYKFELPTEELIAYFLTISGITIEDGADSVAKLLSGKSFAFAKEFVKTAKLVYKRTTLTREEAETAAKRIVKHNERNNLTAGLKRYLPEETKLGMKLVLDKINRLNCK